MTIRFEIPSVPGESIDLRDFGRVGNDDFDNTGSLLAAMAERDTNGKPYGIFACQGDWTFADSLDISGLDDLSIADIVSISGVYAAPTFQHQEEATLATQKQYTRFVINSTSEATVWWDHRRDYRFGPLAFRDVTFRVEDRGSLFNFGDPTNLDQDKVTARGVLFERCYLARFRQYGGSNIGDGRPWLINSGADGYVINQTNQSFGIRASQLYDSHFDVTVRGFKYHVINRQGDRVTGSIRSGIAGIGLVETAAGSPVPSPVGSQFERVWSENHLMAGAIINGQTTSLRTEINTGAFAVPPGVYDLPADVTWSIGIGADYVAFVFPRTFDARDYFEPLLCYKFTPTTANESPRWLQAISVTADRLYFANPTAQSYNPRTFAGNGAGIDRPFGQGVIAYSNRVDLVSASCGGGLDDIPSMFNVPSQAPVRMPGNANGRSGDPNNPQDLVIVANCCGTTDQILGGVDAVGAGTRSNSPLYNADGVGPSYSRSGRDCIYDPHTNTFLANAGRGVNAPGGARSLTFHPQTEESGAEVICLRPSDGGGGWVIRDARLIAGVETTVRARVYCPADNAVVILSGAPSLSVSSAALDPGWQWVNLTITADKMGGDGSGAYVQFLNSGYFVYSAVIDQN